jgi:hypothetical protein
MKEYILCAANHYHNELYSIIGDSSPIYQPRNITSGYVVCGRRHHNIIHLHNYLTKTTQKDCPHTSGFLTNLDRFVGREEALKIALKAGQVLDINNLRGDILFSEDLY